METNKPKEYRVKHWIQLLICSVAIGYLLYCVFTFTLADIGVILFLAILVVLFVDTDFKVEKEDDGTSVSVVIRL